MKKTIQYMLKVACDCIAFPFFLLYVCFLRFCPKRRRERLNVFFGLIANNNLIYVRNSLINLGYFSQVIPWIIPAHEHGIIDYDLDIASLFPRIYKNFFGQLLLIYGLFFWALYRFDVFIMPFRNRLLDRTGFLLWFEFQLLHIAGKKIILNPYGGDIQYLEVWQQSSDKTKHILLKAWESDAYYSQINSAQTIKMIRYGERYADAVIAALEWPDYLKRIDYYLHMRVIPTTEIKNSHLKEHKKSHFTILHATNHPHFKGTEFLIKAIQELNKESKQCELILLEKVTNREVLEKIAIADVIFDQLLMGAYGRLAIEAMSLGKPVICYLRDDLKALYRPWNECPIINATIDNIKDKILHLMQMSAEDRAKIGQKSLEYVKKYHSSEYVGGILDQIIQKVIKDDSNR